MAKLRVGQVVRVGIEGSGRVPYRHYVVLLASDIPGSFRVILRDGREEIQTEEEILATWDDSRRQVTVRLCQLGKRTVDAEEFFTLHFLTHIGPHMLRSDNETGAIVFDALLSRRPEEE